MAELPGWDRDRLRTAAPLDVAAARLIVWVKAWRKLLSRNLGDEIEDLVVADRSDAKAQAKHEHKRRLQAIEDLKETARLQAAVRARLGLEPLDG